MKNKCFAVLTRGKKSVLNAVLWVAVLLLLCGTTFAWYLETQSARGKQVNITSDSHEVSLSQFTVYFSDGAAVSETDCSIALKSYDSVFGKNEKTPLYILIPVGGSAVESRKPLTFEVAFDGRFSNEEAPPKVEAYLSNVAQMRYRTILSPEPASADYAATMDYDMLRSLFQSDDPVYTFVDYELDDAGDILGSPVKENIIMSYSDYPQEEPVKTVYLILELDYNPKLAQNYLINQYGNVLSGRLDQVYSHSFSSDITTITVSSS